MRVRRDEGGAAIIEFALVLPLVVLLLFGIVEFGRGYNARIQLTSAVREGARAAALGGDPVATTRGAATGLTATSIAVTSTGCAAPATSVTVSATYPFHYEIPLYGTGNFTLKASGVMRCGG
jgi:Flp pilus assembly protein TadG